MKYKKKIHIMSKVNVKINLLQAFEGNVVTLEEAFKDSIKTSKVNDKQFLPLEVLKGKRWICVDDLEGEHFFKKNNGDVQLQVEVAEKREVDKFRNSHSVSLQQSKTTKESGAARKYCGDGKQFIFVQAKLVETATTENLLAEANTKKLEEEDDLVF